MKSSSLPKMLLDAQQFPLTPYNLHPGLYLLEGRFFHISNIELKDEKGRTPLHDAVARGDATMFEWLLRNDARVDTRDNANQTPLNTAFGCIKNKETRFHIIDLLLKEVSKWHEKEKTAFLDHLPDTDYLYESAICQATLQGDIALVERLHKEGAKIHFNFKTDLGFKRGVIFDNWVFGKIESNEFFVPARFKEWMRDQRLFFGTPLRPILNPPPVKRRRDPAYEAIEDAPYAYEEVHYFCPALLIASWQNNFKLAAFFLSIDVLGARFHVEYLIMNNSAFSKKCSTLLKAVDKFNLADRCTRVVGASFINSGTTEIVSSFKEQTYSALLSVADSLAGSKNGNELKQSDDGSRAEKEKLNVANNLTDQKNDNELKLSDNRQIAEKINLNTVLSVVKKGVAEKKEPSLKELNAVNQSRILSKLNLKDEDGNTATHLAAAAGFEIVVSWLIEKGADITVVNRWGLNPLAWALCRMESMNDCNFRIINQFLTIADSWILPGKKMDFLNKGNSYFVNNILVVAIHKDYTNVADALLKRNVQINYRLDLFADLQIISFCELLEERQKDVHSFLKDWVNRRSVLGDRSFSSLLQSFFGTSLKVDVFANRIYRQDGVREFSPALLVACFQGSCESARKLLENGANPVVAHDLCQFGAFSKEFTDYFLELPQIKALKVPVQVSADSKKDAIVKPSTIPALSVLSYLTVNFHDPKLEEKLNVFYLTKSNKDLEVQDEKGCTALQCAVALGKADIVAWLLRMDAKPVTYDSQGKTPLINAIELIADSKVRLRVVKDILNAINTESIRAKYVSHIPDELQNSAIFRAVLKRDLDVVNVLLNENAQINYRIGSFKYSQIKSFNKWIKDNFTHWQMPDFFRKWVEADSRSLEQRGVIPDPRSLFENENMLSFSPVLLVACWVDVPEIVKALVVSGKADLEFTRELRVVHAFLEKYIWLFAYQEKLRFINHHYQNELSMPPCEAKHLEFLRAGAERHGFDNGSIDPVSNTTEPSAPPALVANSKQALRASAAWTSLFSSSTAELKSVSCEGSVSVMEGIPDKPMDVKKVNNILNELAEMIQSTRCDKGTSMMIEGKMVGLRNLLALRRVNDSQQSATQPNIETPKQAV